MSEEGWFKEVTHADRSAFSLPRGIRAGVIALVPLVLGLAVHNIELIFATLGAMFLTNTDGPPFFLPARVLLVACFTESAAVGLGTLSATTGLLSPLFVGIAVAVALLARGSPMWANVGTFTAIIFAVGAGLQGASLEGAGLRAVLLLLGSLFALFGVVLQRMIAKRKNPTAQTKPPPVQTISRSENIRSAIVVGVLSAFGLLVGHALGLPRDYWAVLTLIIAVRPNLSLTITFASTMAVGAVAGAVIAAGITLETTDVNILLPLLFVFAILMFASRGVNVGLGQVFLVPYLVILLNILYPGAWYFALYRILEVGMGVGLALVAVYVLSEMKKD
jgi:hypothetical protein